MKKKILVTSALPYANGPLHIGHLAGCYLPADIYYRYKKSKGEEIIHICGTDEHGVQMTLKADEEGVTPKDVVDKYYDLINKTLKDIGIYYDNFSRTTKDIHKKTAQDFFKKIFENNYLEEKEMQQFYCKKCKRFLPDRFVEGICPFCKSEGARGDQCESCGRWIESTELIEPMCKTCKTKPEIKTTKHWFIKLNELTDNLKEWQNKHSNWKDNVKKFCKNWFDEGLQSRAITRDIKWGVPVPFDNAKGKVLYVWFDAPIGYISSTMEWASEKKNNSQLWKDYWLDKDTKLVHFIGKDNIVFHAIVWPAMLMAHGDIILPDEIPANEFLNIEGKKLSTSRNWAIWVDEVIKDFSPDVLRFVLAANAPENSDVDFSWKEFQRRANDELADIFGNLINRTLIFIQKYYNNEIPPFKNEYENEEIISEIKQSVKIIGDYFETFQVRKAVAELIKLAKVGNKFFASNEPWKSVKDDKKKCDKTISLCAALVDTLSTIIEPVLPFTAEKILKTMNLKKREWQKATEFRITEKHKIGKIEILFKKIEDKDINKQFEKLGKPREDNKFVKYAEISDLEKLKLKVGKIISIEKVKKSDRLYKLEVDIGNEIRQVIAGLVNFYKEEDLLGKSVILVSNLKPVKIRGIESQGMILAADDGKIVSILKTEKELPVGSQVR